MDLQPDRWITAVILPLRTIFGGGLGAVASRYSVPFGRRLYLPPSRFGLRQASQLRRLYGLKSHDRRRSDR
jgi:hypothetical protein